MSKRQARIVGNLEVRVNPQNDWRIRLAYSGFAMIMIAVLILDRADSWLVRFGFAFGFGAVHESEDCEGVCTRI